jgi:alpha-methylacyl-CoA racemase
LSAPLAGTSVVEVGGIGPSPFGGMLLADLGADVLRIDRPGGAAGFPLAPADQVLHRGKRLVELDLRAREGIERLLELVDGADVLTEGFRPGVAERLGFGPDVCRARNPRLVYARMTGWGQTGPLAARAGHDINYIALTGALHAIGPAGGPPQIPLNLVGDFGGGGMYLVVGILAALLAAQRTGIGDVVDAAILDGTAHLLGAIHGLLNGGAWADARGENLLDGGAPFYGVYETADGRHMAVGAIEPQFYAHLDAVLQTALPLEAQFNRATWGATRSVLASAFRRETQREWTHRFADVDACVSPVLTLAEAADDPHVRARGSVVRRADGLHPGPAPRFAGHAPPG